MLFKQKHGKFAEHCVIFIMEHGLEKNGRGMGIESPGIWEFSFIAPFLSPK